MSTRWICFDRDRSLRLIVNRHDRDLEFCTEASFCLAEVEGALVSSHLPFLSRLVIMAEFYSDYEVWMS